MDTNFATIPEALEDIRAGRFVIVMDDYDRENEGDLVMAAEFVTPEATAFAVQYTTGILCAPMTAFRAEQLQLPLMVPPAGNTDRHCTAFTVTTDSIDTSTGVNAVDRSTTFNQLSDQRLDTSHFRRPGHVFPLIAKPGGVLERRGHTEAAVDLCKLAGVTEVALIAELVNRDGSMKRLYDCVAFGAKHDLKLITIQELVSYRLTGAEM